MDSSTRNCHSIMRMVVCVFMHAQAHRKTANAQSALVLKCSSWCPQATLQQPQRILRDPPLHPQASGAVLASTGLYIPRRGAYLLSCHGLQESQARFPLAT